MATAIMKQKEVRKWTMLKRSFQRYQKTVLQNGVRHKENLDDRAGNGKAAGIKKRQIDFGWCIKCFLNLKRLPERYESILPALKNGTPIRLNTIKLPEKNRGKN